MYENHDESWGLLPHAVTRYDDPNYDNAYCRSVERADAQKLQLISASSITASAVQWIYRDLIAKEELTVIFGAPDVGKSTLLCRFAAGVTAGETNDQSEGLKPNCAGKVLILDIENSIEKTILPRLKAAGANLANVHFIGKSIENNEHETFSFANKKHIDRLEIHCRLLGGVVMIILDPIYAAVKGDANNDAQARRAYENLAALAKRLNCAIVGIAHTVKNAGKKYPLLDRLSGPRALREVPRSIMLVENLPASDDGIKDEKVLVAVKSNLCRSNTGIAFVIEAVDIGTPTEPMKTTRTAITRTIHGTAEEILGGNDVNNSGKKVRKGDAAMDFLLEVLEGGAQLRNDIEALAVAAGIRLGTLLKAKADLKIVTKKRKGDGLSEWSLPA